MKATEIKLNLKTIEDANVRDLFFRLQNFVNESLGLFAGFELFILNFTGAVTKQKVRHNLGFVPIDTIVTHNPKNLTITFYPDEFTAENVVVSSSGAGKIRFIAGRFKEGVYGSA